MSNDVYYRVLWVPNHYPELSVGDVGIRASERVFQGKVALKFDSVSNIRSTNGWFYLPTQCIERVKGDITTMSTQIKLSGNYRVALVSFIEGTNTSMQYEYACYDDSINVNDKCVVKSATHGFGIATVVRFVDNVGQKIHREIVCKADFSAYEERLEKRVKEAELITKMRHRSEELQEILLYETLAKADPEMSALFNNYKAIWGEQDGN